MKLFNRVKKASRIDYKSIIECMLCKIFNNVDDEDLDEISITHTKDNKKINRYEQLMSKLNALNINTDLISSFMVLFNSYIDDIFNKYKNSKCSNEVLKDINKNYYEFKNGVTSIVKTPVDIKFNSLITEKLSFSDLKEEIFKIADEFKSKELKCEFFKYINSTIFGENDNDILSSEKIKEELNYIINNIEGLLVADRIYTKAINTCIDYCQFDKKKSKAIYIQLKDYMLED